MLLLDLCCRLVSRVEDLSPTICCACVLDGALSRLDMQCSVSREMESRPEGSSGQFSGIISSDPVGSTSW